jgi:chloride channel protein, CIC family
MSIQIPTAPFLRFSLLAVLTGLAAGVGAILFRDLIALFHNLFFLGTLSLQYDTNVHTPAGPWGVWIIIVPVLGGLLVAFLVKNFAPEAKGHGVPEVIESIYYGRSIIRPVVSVIKAFASAISIGSGAAVGREGPIIQIGSAFGSTLGQALHMPHWQRTVLIGCGAGGGIAATFNTPIGGLLFAIEIMLPEISHRTLIPVALATGAATFVGRAAFGEAPAFDVPSLIISRTIENTPMNLAAYLLLGLLLGLVAVIYIRSIYFAEDLFDRIPGNYYTRHALGMLCLGLMMYAFLRYSGQYYIQGVGYSSVQEILSQQLLDPAFLLLLFAAKLLATALSLGSGASGGIFSPSLFLGAALGGAYALLANAYLLDIPLDIPATAMIGMAGVVAGATGAVVTAIVMVFEMTRDYNVIIPLMITASVAYGVRRGLLSDSIYTLKLTRRGLTLPDSCQTNLYLMYTARDALDIPVLRRPAPDPTPLSQLLKTRGRRPHLVAESDGHVAGIVPDLKLAQIVPQTPLNEIFATHAATDFLVVRADDSLLDVFMRLRDAEQDVAVVTASGTLQSAEDVEGVLTWSQVARTSNLPRRLHTRRNHH